MVSDAAEDATIWRRPVSYRTPLARPPFPRVRRTRTQERALMRAIAGLPLGPYPRVLTCPGEKRVSAVAQRAVLEAVAARGNGAGFSFMRVVTIASESGQASRTVYRALLALEAQGHLERFFFRDLLGLITARDFPRWPDAVRVPTFTALAHLYARVPACTRSVDPRYHQMRDGPCASSRGTPGR